MHGAQTEREFVSWWWACPLWEAGGTLHAPPPSHGVAGGREKGYHCDQVLRYTNLLLPCYLSERQQKKRTGPLELRPSSVACAGAALGQQPIREKELTRRAAAAYGLVPLPAGRIEPDLVAGILLPPAHRPLHRGQDRAPSASQAQAAATAVAWRRGGSALGARAAQGDRDVPRIRHLARGTKPEK